MWNVDGGGKDFREFRELRIERPDENTVEFYIDGSLDTTISMPFAGDYNPYFAADGHTVPNRIEVDFVEVKRA
jgi:hypothetical protein